MVNGSFYLCIYIICHLNVPGVFEVALVSGDYMGIIDSYGDYVGSMEMDEPSTMVMIWGYTRNGVIKHGNLGNP